MEELKLIMDDVMKNRQAIEGINGKTVMISEAHNNLVDSYLDLKTKHNRLCKSVAMLGICGIVTELMLLSIVIDISKLKKEEKKEG